jgi:shikimate dehydrogenase
MKGQPALDIDLWRLPSSALVTDIVYTPLETRLLKLARQRGNQTVPGLGMLLYQAVPGFELWFGVRPTVTPELYDLVAADLELTP